MNQKRVLKLTKSVNRKVGDITYEKFIITIPKEHVTDLGWSEKTELRMKNDGKRLIIEKK